MTLRLARRVAERSTHPHHRHASIVLRGGAVVATGYNHDDRHAEIVALSKLWPSKRKGTTVMNLRLTNAGTVGLAKPCGECLAFLLESGVESVKWTTRTGMEEARL